MIFTILFKAVFNKKTFTNAKKINYIQVPIVLIPIVRNKGFLTGENVTSKNAISAECLVILVTIGLGPNHVRSSPTRKSNVSKHIAVEQCRTHCHWTLPSYSHTILITSVTIAKPVA